MRTTENDNVTTRQGGRDHDTETRAMRKTAAVIATVRGWARSRDHQLHRR